MIELYGSWLLGWAEVDREKYLDDMATAIMSMTRYGRMTLTEAVRLPRRWQVRFARALDGILSKEGASFED